MTELRPSAGMPAFRAAIDLARALSQFAVRWGPTGSVGFSLASGAAVVRADSDLDLVIRVCSPLPDLAGVISQLVNCIAAQRCRIDCQVETPAGLVALEELISRRPRILVRRDNGGAVLTDNPWLIGAALSPPP